jgi:N-acetylneuraminic acid mutarotase
MYFSIATLALLLLNTLVAIVSPARPHSHKGSWESLKPIPLYPRQEHTTVLLPPHTLATLGGVVPSNSSIPPVDTTALMHFYHITNNTWTTKAPMPRPLNHVNVTVVNGLIYVLGGLAETDDTKRAWRPVGDSWMYTSFTDTWSSLPTIPVGE